MSIVCVNFKCLQTAAIDLIRLVFPNRPACQRFDSPRLPAPPHHHSRRPAQTARQDRIAQPFRDAAAALFVVPHFASSTTIANRLPRFAGTCLHRLFMSLRGAQQRSNLLPYNLRLAENGRSVPVGELKETPHGVTTNKMSHEDAVKRHFAVVRIGELGVVELDSQKVF